MAGVDSAWAEEGTPSPAPISAPATPPLAKVSIPTGPGFGFDFSFGLIGQFASVNVGLLLPKIGEHFQIGLRGSWSMPAIGLAHRTSDGSATIIYLPWMAYGGIFFQGGTGVVRDLARAYGGGELFMGTTMAVDAGIIGDNVTIGSNLYGGVELYLSQGFAMFLEAGLAVVFTVEYANRGLLAGINQHGGTGFFIRFGPRWYFGTGE